MRDDIFETVRQMVSTRAAAELYGFHPNRAGYICCPFHGEKTASLKLYDDGGWHCFGCNTGGSSIDFAAQLLGLTPLDAVKRLNDDFCLGLPIGQPPSETQQRVVQRRRDMAETYRRFEIWRDRFLSMLSAAHLKAHMLHGVSPDKLTEVEALAVRWKPVLEYWSDCLDCGRMKEQMQIFRDRGDIERLCKKILSNTPMRSGTA